MTEESGPADDGRDPSLGEIMSERPQLINLAYRLLGSLTDAEDVVQEAYTRWYAMAPERQETIVSPFAWLTTVASRICLDLRGSARTRREKYVGEWIPEPIPGGTEWINRRLAGAANDAVDPADRVTLDESLNMAFLVVLESMSPAERVAFILHDVFCYSFVEVAEIVGRSPAACRQLASSARRHLRTSGALTAPATRRAQLVGDFKRAWEAKDIEALITILDPSVTTIADGGGLASALPDAVVGATQVARMVVEIAHMMPDVTIQQRIVNGQPGLVMLRDGETVTVLAFHTDGDRITHIWAVRNPEKLKAWTTD